MPRTMRRACTRRPLTGSERKWRSVEAIENFAGNVCCTGGRPIASMRQRRNLRRCLAEKRAVAAMLNAYHAIGRIVRLGRLRMRVVSTAEADRERGHPLQRRERYEQQDHCDFQKLQHGCCETSTRQITAGLQRVRRCYRRRLAPPAPHCGMYGSGTGCSGYFSSGTASRGAAAASGFAGRWRVLWLPG